MFAQSNKMQKKLEKSIEKLQEEIEKLRELHQKGRFGLTQAEFSLQRLATKLINVWREKNES